MVQDMDGIGKPINRELGKGDPSTYKMEVSAFKTASAGDRSRVTIPHRNLPSHKSRSDERKQCNNLWNYRPNDV
jgi:hypothetical protein